jgi:hypothetical protein
VKRKIGKRKKMRMTKIYTKQIYIKNFVYRPSSGDKSVLLIFIGLFENGFSIARMF